jgi:hypothetical protein
VIVTGFSHGPIRWPVGRRADGDRGISGPVVFGALAEAVRTEQVYAVARAWGVTRQMVAKWRKRLGVGLSPAARGRLAAAAKKRIRVSGKLPNGPAWTAVEDAAVLALPPRDAARKTGRPIGAVYARRSALRQRGKYPVQGWATPYRRAGR